MDFEKIDKILASEPAYRRKQVNQLIWRDLIETWDEATTLPAALREKLAQECPLEIKAEVFPDKDNKSAKALIILADGLNVESVLMRHEKSITPSVSPSPRLRESEAGPFKGGEEKKRNTICVSSQVGCPLGCLFCATGRMGFKRSLSSGEILEQALFWSRRLKKENVSPFEKGPLRLVEDEARGLRGISKSLPTSLLQREESERVNNVVFMGMGEPFLNYDNVFSAIKVLNDDNLLGIGARHISISTAGIIEGIERMAEDMPQINLAISLHAPNDELRSKLMPINKKYSLIRVMAAAADYVERTNRKLMFEYIMIKGVNDSLDYAKELVSLLDNPLYFVNLIVYNKTGEFTPSDPTQVKKFKDFLMKHNVQTLERFRFGQDIGGACGQLITKNK